MITKNIHISDYDYPLPDERIAKFPLSQRDSSKLLLYKHGTLGEDIFSNLPSHLPEGALMVFNNTKVIQARIHFRKASGALIEVFLLEPVRPRDYEQMFQSRQDCSWVCMVGNLKKWKEGALTRLIETPQGMIQVTASRRGEHATGQLIDFSWSFVSDSSSSSQAATLSFAELIDIIGELPIPPYLHRDTQESDKTTYQTVYSKVKGSVAAPTAGLHFTEQVLCQLDSRGIDREEVTLHVGAGTFKPVKSEEIAGHEMHTEYVSVQRKTLERLLQHDCKAIAVGTTTVRTLESLYYIGVILHENPEASAEHLHVSQWEPYETQPTLSPQEAILEILSYLDRHQLNTLHASTQIIIAPGYEFKIVRMLITNFHQPKSTLLLLVSAFLHGDWRRIYDYALDRDFRFLSYGDSSLLIP